MLPEEDEEEEDGPRLVATVGKVQQSNCSSWTSPLLKATARVPEEWEKARAVTGPRRPTSRATSTHGALCRWGAAPDAGASGLLLARGNDPGEWSGSPGSAPRPWGPWEWAWAGDALSRSRCTMADRMPVDERAEAPREEGDRDSAPKASAVGDRARDVPTTLVARDMDPRYTLPLLNNRATMRRRRQAVSSRTHP